MRQEHTNTVERQSVQDGYRTSHGAWSRMCWAVRKKEERKLHTTEMCMLRWARGKQRLLPVDHVRNVDIWKEAHVYPMAEFLREKRLRWFGHVQRRDNDEDTRKILQRESRWKAKSGQTKAEMARPGERGYGKKPDDN